MADDFLPRGDQEFCTWLRNFLMGSSRGDRIARFSLRSEDLEWLREDSAALEEAMAQQNQFKRQAAAARVSKDALRRRCEESAREIAGKLQHSFGITPADRAELGLRLPKPRVTSAAANQPPATSPHLRVQSLPRRHLLHFVDEKTPSRKIKPPRVAFCEIWRNCPPAAAQRSGRKPATATATEAHWTFLACCSATPQAVLYTPAEAGKVVSYRCRWVTHRGKPGPWSNTVTASVSE